MYKLIFGAKRKPGMSREEFGRYWTTVHAEKAKKVRHHPLRHQPRARPFGQRPRASLRRLRRGVVRERGGHATLGPLARSARDAGR